MRTITCESCGRPASAPNARTKYCTTCRLGRQAKWHKGFPSQCRQCDADYIAWYGPKDWQFCAAHMLGPGRDSIVGRCADCKRDGRNLFNRDVRLCYACLLDPSAYGRVRQYILKRLNEVTQ